MKNKQVSPRTKHIDVRYHILRYLYDENRLKVNKVKSEDNLSDGLTKNTGLELFKSHTEVVLTGGNTSTQGEY